MDRDRTLGTDAERAAIEREMRAIARRRNRISTQVSLMAKRGGERLRPVAFYSLLDRLAEAELAFAHQQKALHHVSRRAGA